MRAKDGQYCVLCERHGFGGSSYNVRHTCHVIEKDRINQVTGTTYYHNEDCDLVRDTKWCVWTPKTKENM